MTPEWIAITEKESSSSYSSNWTFEQRLLHCVRGTSAPGSNRKFPARVICSSKLFKSMFSSKWAAKTFCTICSFPLICRNIPDLFSISTMHKHCSVHTHNGCGWAEEIKNEKKSITAKLCFGSALKYTAEKVQEVAMWGWPAAGWSEGRVCGF